MCRGAIVLAEGAQPAAHSHVASLPALIARVLAQAGLRISDVEALGVSIGPGSFTGLRIGLGLAKGIAFAGGVPVAAVSTLEALAAAADATPGQVVYAALDARKREVYAAAFRVAPDGALERLGPDRVLAPAALAGELPAGTVLVGDAGEAYPDAWPAHTIRRPFATHHPRGGIVARLAAARLAAGEAADPGALEPVYVRAPEAELARAEARVDTPAGRVLPSSPLATAEGLAWREKTRS